jgi:predicted nucleotidyltransferase
MISPKYLQRLEEMVSKHLQTHSAKAFVFGSSIDPKRQKFYDVDLGIIGDIDESTLYQLGEELEESTFPYKVDIIDFNKVEKKFKDFVFSDHVQWLHQT